jgi:endoglucanase
MNKVFVLATLAGCAQFRPPAEGAGGGGGCPVSGDSYTYADEAGSQVAGDARRITGTLASGGEVFAGVGLSFPEPVDASRYRGIAFLARRGPGAAAHVRLKVPDVNTDPDGGVCTDCYNDFGISFQVTEEWTRYEAPFADLVQETGWGAPRPAAIDTSKLYGVQWQLAVAGAAVDLQLDQIEFLGCQE